MSHESRKCGAWKVVHDGPSYGMLESPDGRVFCLKELNGGPRPHDGPWATPIDNEELCKAFASALSETEATTGGMRKENFIQAALNISAERRKGYERREHGDLVNKRCADDLETLCGEYLSRLSERGG